MNKYSLAAQMWGAGIASLEQLDKINDKYAEVEV